MARLTTPYEKKMDKACPHAYHPTPQLKRPGYLCLNGEWDFLISKSDNAGDLTEKILVPFPPESRISGVDRITKAGDTLTYRRTFTLPQGFRGGRWLLHFGAVDQVATVKLNSRELGVHEGGYLPFELDITDFLTEGENTVTVEVTDKLDHDLGWGKQRHDRGGMWYTPISGIWQAVWLEAVPQKHIKSLKITPTLTSVTIQVEGGDENKVLTLKQSGDTYGFCGDSITIELQNPQLWSPENPYLYEFTLESGEDKIESYFALRTVECRKIGDTPRICLNGKPYFFHGLLDQGYFSDGIFLPATPDGFERDILAAKRLGFNMLRKHIKIEPERFYYDCDRLGVAVFQDMVNNSDYSFFRDTALPTVGIKSLDDKKLHKDKRSREAFLSAMDETAERLSFHPSVVYWTIFNEGWGQFDHASAYERLKCIDDSRIIDSVSGWFTPKKANELKSDVSSHHVYFKPVKLKKADEKPLVLSEFGGYSLKVAGHTFNLKDNYGYSTMKSEAEFEAALERLYLGEVLTAIKESGLSAAVYTQLTDVEDETNGLLTYDRRVTKVSETTMQNIAKALFEAGKGDK